MAAPLRKAANGYDVAAPWQPDRQPAGRTARTASRRLVRRDVRSNAEYRQTIAWAILGVLFVLFVIAISSTVLKAGISHRNYYINAIRMENESLLAENDRIRGDIAALRSLERIEAYATQELGMIKNESIDYMILSSTITAEGKVRIADAGAQEEQARPQTLVEAIRYFLSRNNKEK